jgi:uncharacterized membrane protein
MEDVKQLLEWSATAIEVGTVLILVSVAAFGLAHFLFRLSREGESAYKQFRNRLGKALILALEFMVAADIVRSVALEQTFANVGILGLLILIRTFLSWSLSVEIYGHWPWSKHEVQPQIEEAGS